jgi:hypothetical protein
VDTTKLINQIKWSYAGIQTNNFMKNHNSGEKKYKIYWIWKII